MTVAFSFSPCTEEAAACLEVLQGEEVCMLLAEVVGKGGTSVVVKTTLTETKT